jgi:hypothetical protein
MPPQNRVPTVGRYAGAAIRGQARRLLVAVAAVVLGLLPGVQGLAPVVPAAVLAAPPDQPDAAAPTSGTADTVPSTTSHPMHDALDDAVVSTGASDEQLDVSAELDQGARLFFLQAHYQDGDYYLAGRQGVSHQPLSAPFAPLRDWLAAPEHEHALVVLGLSTDPRSADPTRFDAACQAFTGALGPYLLRTSDLPEGKVFGELTPEELAALQSRPLVVTDWAACTGDHVPLARPRPRAAVESAPYQQWMADSAQAIGQRPLRQVIIPGSHDAATYGNFGASIVTDYAQAQTQDITAQQRWQPLLRSALHLLRLGHPSM